MKDKQKIINKIGNALNANDLDSARKLVENDLKRLNCKDEYYFYSALISSDLNTKLDLYSRAISENPAFMDAYINRGLVKNELQDFEGSIEDYNKAIEIDPKCALAYNNRGYTKYKKQDIEGALEDYNKAILLNPKFQMAIDNKARLVSEVCVNDSPDFMEKYYLSLGILEINSGNIQEALKNLEESLKYNDKSEVTYFYKGVAFHSLGKTEESYSNYSKAIELNKNMVDAYYNRGQLVVKTNPKQAIDDFVAALALDSKFIDAYYALAAVQKNIGQYDDALKNLDKILSLEPNAVNAKALKKLILTKYKKTN